MPRSRTLLAAVTPSLVVLAACGADPSDGSTATANGPSVVTALYPLAFVAERVGAGDIALTNLAAPGVEPHDLELAPRQVGAIADAAVIVYLGGFAPAVDEAVEQNAADRALDVATVVTLAESTGEGTHADADEDPAGEHAQEGVDPHFWLDPLRLAAVAASLADRLAEIDPDHAEGYAVRAATLAEDLAALDHELETGLARCDTRTIVTAHAAFAYLAERYGLEQLSVAGLEPDAEPSAARITDVQAAIEADEVTTVYFEPLTSSAVVDAIAGDLDLATAELDPIESASPGADYLTLMTRNLGTLRDGQGCS